MVIKSKKTQQNFLNSLSVLYPKNERLSDTSSRSRQKKKK